MAKRARVCTRYPGCVPMHCGIMAAVRDFEYSLSCGAHTRRVDGRYAGLVPSQRETWIGDDYSGFIRESSGPESWFTDEASAQGEGARLSSVRRSPSTVAFGPGCLGGSRARRDRVSHAQGGVLAALVRYTTDLNELKELLGEGAPDAELCAIAHSVARNLPTVNEVRETADQLGRVGPALIEIRDARRTELIFTQDYGELLGSRHVLSEDQWFAPAGTVASWTSYLERGRADALPLDAPPLPSLPCEPRFSGRVLRVDSEFSLVTGDAIDVRAQLDTLHSDGVLTEAQYEASLQHPGID
jgi:hypothetical protein